MSASFRTIQKNYVQKFPTEVPTKAAQGFIATAVINLVVDHPGKVAFVGGVIAATATIIEALTRPIILTVFPEYPWFAECIQVGISRIIALGLAASASPWTGVSYEISSLLLSVMASIALNDRFYERNVGRVEIF